MNEGTRLLDVNLNRGSEACRVLEDVARFTLGDERVAGDLKSLRHGLTSAVLMLESTIEATRSGSEDVGRSTTTAAELTRQTMESIVRAAGSRLGQAIRVMEEVAKLSDPTVAQRLEAMRYQSYDLSGEVIARCARGCRNQWQTCLLLTCQACLAGWREVLEAAIAGGIQCIQVREKTMTDAALLRHSREVVEIAHACGGIVIIDDRPDIAVASGADGVHVGSDDLPVTTCREIVGSALVIGATGATPDRVAGLIDEGADYCGVGAVLASRTRPDRTIIGVKGFQQVAADPRVDPTMLVAIGGLGSASMTPLIAAGCTRVAVSEAICAAESPRRAAEDIVAAVDAPLVHRQQAAHGPG